MNNAIDSELTRQVSVTPCKLFGPVAEIAQKYTLESDRLVGLLLKVDFEDSLIVTCDPWKRKCGGVPRGSFILFRIDPRAVNPADSVFSNRLILARITNSAPTPVEGNIQQTLFQVHKLQAQLDPLTHKDLQWGALKATVVGTYYDLASDEGLHISFGNDIDTFLTPFAYVAYMPLDSDLTTLINSFVKCKNPIEIGKLRYTETPSPTSNLNVPIFIDPQDIVGEPTAAQRLANFGKTRFGKSNSNKIIAKAIFESDLDVSQVFFDPSGEYTYINDQDKTSLFAMFSAKSVRYSLVLKEQRKDETSIGLSSPRLLSVNFYKFPSVGHSLITALWDTENPTAPGYIRPVLDWSPTDPDQAPSPRNDISAFRAYP